MAIPFFLLQVTETDLLISPIPSVHSTSELHKLFEYGSPEEVEDIRVLSKNTNELKTCGTFSGDTHRDPSNAVRDSPSNSTSLEG